jgi:hypothetical protein
VKGLGFLRRAIRDNGSYMYQILVLPSLLSLPYFSRFEVLPKLLPQFSLFPCLPLRQLEGHRCDFIFTLTKSAIALSNMKKNCRWYGSVRDTKTPEAFFAIVKAKSAAETAMFRSGMLSFVKSLSMHWKRSEPRKTISYSPD